MPGLKNNLLYSILLTTSTYIFNLLVFPYISRVFGPETMGVIGMATNFANYSSTVAMLGVTIVGIREIAYCGDDRQRRSEVFSSLVKFISVTTFSVILLYFLCLVSFERLWSQKELYIIGAMTVFFTSYLVEWLYRGIENFKYITLRSIIIKSIYVVSVFVFVKDSDDYILYFAMTSAVVVVNALVNIVHSRKYVDFSFRKGHVSEYAKSASQLGVYTLLVNVFTTFNVVFLGFVNTDEQAGYYYVATLVFNIIMALLTAYSNVMMPRLSSLLSEDRTEEFDEKVGQSFNLVFMFSFPLIAGCVILAPQLISILAGDSYDGAVLPMRLIMPLILLVGLAQIWVLQVLVPLKEDKVITWAAFFAAVATILADFILVPRFGAIGSAIVLVVAEVVNDSISLIYALRKGYISFPLKRMFVNLFWSIPYVPLCYLAVSFHLNSIWTLLLAFMMCLAYFVVCNVWIIKDESVIRIFNSFLRNPQFLSK